MQRSGSERFTQKCVGLACVLVLACLQNDIRCGVGETVEEEFQEADVRENEAFTRKHEPSYEPCDHECRGAVLFDAEEIEAHVRRRYGFPRVRKSA